MKIIVEGTIEELKEFFGGSEVERKETKKEVKDNKSSEKVSQYARFFDEGCIGWSEDSEYNLMFLRTQNEYANDMLKSKGTLYLNEVYDLLGIPRTKAGQLVGWMYDGKYPYEDNFVDFGLSHPRNADFINGYSKTALLDFNVVTIIETL